MEQGVIKNLCEQQSKTKDMYMVIAYELKYATEESTEKEKEEARKKAKRYAFESGILYGVKNGFEHTSMVKDLKPLTP